MMPARGIDMNALAHILGIATSQRGKRGKQLYESRFGCLVQSQVGQEVSRSGEEERLDLRLVESRQVRAIFFQQAPSTAYAAFGCDENTCRAQSLHIPMDGALGHLQPLRQFTCRHAAVYLQEQHDR